MNHSANMLRVRLDDETEVVFETTLFEEGREELATRGKGEIPEAPERLDALPPHLRRTKETKGHAPPLKPLGTKCCARQRRDRAVGIATKLAR